MLQNIRLLVHGWVACDDRDADDAFSNEVNRRRALPEMAQLGISNNLNRFSRSALPNGRL